MNNSDKTAKYMCKQFLEREGYEKVTIRGRDGFDIEGIKDGKAYYFEVKSSNRNKEEVFGGTVMLTELNRAIKDKDSYRFIICRGKDNDINEWTFELFGVDEFMQFCFLTTPILRYSYHNDFQKQPKPRKETRKADDDLIRLMWSEFEKWKKEQGEEEIEEITDGIKFLINPNNSWDDIKDKIRYDFGKDAIDDLLKQGVNDEPNHRRFTKSINDDVFSYVYIVFGYKHIHLHINVKDSEKAEMELREVFKLCPNVKIKQIDSGLSTDINQKEEFDVLKKWLKL